MSKHRIAAIWGTRPERIKMAPVVEALNKAGVAVITLKLGQNKDLDGSPLSSLWDGGVIQGIGKVLEHMEWEFRHGKPDAVVVQGDTATAFACTLAAYLAGIPVAHVEAGLRTYQREPYPEEAFRRMIAAMATWHFCPDRESAMNVWTEIGFTRRAALVGADGDWNVHIVGNTVIDTLPNDPLEIFCTLHRRENWGERTQKALNALSEAARRRQSHLRVTVVRHPNWQAQAMEPPPEHETFRYIEPVSHDRFIEAIREADLVVTDSGGLQEEAAHFGVPCVVYRTSTERVSLLRQEMVVLASPDDENSLTKAIDSFVDGRRAYGHGDAGTKIARILVEQLDSLKGIKRPKPRNPRRSFEPLMD